MWKFASRLSNGNINAYFIYNSSNCDPKNKNVVIKSLRGNNYKIHRRYIKLPVERDNLFVTNNETVHKTFFPILSLLYTTAFYCI